MSELAYFIGIDPGVSGGIAIIDHLGLVIRVVKMPATEREILEALEVPPLSAWLPQAERPARRAVLEKVNAGVFGHGKAGRMGVLSAFTFGRGVGRLEMALCAARIPFDAVSPQSWQAALGCKSGGDKNVTKRRAQQLFPSEKVTHATADALLLAEFCRRYWRQIATKGSVDGQTETVGEVQREVSDAQVVAELDERIQVTRKAAASRAAWDGARAQRPAR